MEEGLRAIPLAQVVAYHFAAKPTQQADSRRYSVQAVVADLAVETGAAIECADGDVGG